MIEDGRKFAREIYGDGIPLEALMVLVHSDIDEGTKKFNEGIELECAVIYAMEEKEHATIN